SRSTAPWSASAMPRADRPEARVQRPCVALLRGAGFLFCHVPNERQQHLIPMGVEPGTPDLLICDLPPLAVEMKSETGRLRPAQKEKLAAFACAGWGSV